MIKRICQPTKLRVEPDVRDVLKLSTQVIVGLINLTFITDLSWGINFTKFSWLINKFDK